MNHSRYQRQLQLHDFGATGQNRLQRSKVLVVGAGGLGIPVLQYLNAMGVGTLGIVDGDTVSKSNLHRQVLYNEEDIGQFKVAIAAAKLQKQNHTTQLNSYPEFLTVANALEIIKGYDLVVDASDNFPTRYLVNDACIILKKPFIYGGLHGYEGQVSVFNFKDGPTYRCLFPDMPMEGTYASCNTNGVLGVLPGIIGNLQGLEAVKICTGIGNVLSGKLLLYNGLDQTIFKVRVQKNVKNEEILRLKTCYSNINQQVKNTEISGLKFIKLYNANNGITLIDVRSHQEFLAHHLPSAKNIPLETLETRQSEIETNGPVYLICQSGKRSGMALQILQKYFPNLEMYSVSGGYDKLA